MPCGMRALVRGTGLGGPHRSTSLGRLLLATPSPSAPPHGTPLWTLCSAPLPLAILPGAPRQRLHLRRPRFRYLLLLVLLFALGVRSCPHRGAVRVTGFGRWPRREVGSAWLGLGAGETGPFGPAVAAVGAPSDAFAVPLRGTWLATAHPLVSVFVVVHPTTSPASVTGDVAEGDHQWVPGRCGGLPNARPPAPVCWWDLLLGPRASLSRIPPLPWSFRPIPPPSPLSPLRCGDRARRRGPAFAPFLLPLPFLVPGR